MPISLCRTTFIIAVIIAAWHAGIARVTASEMSREANVYEYAKPFTIQNIRLQQPNGQVLSLADYRGRVVLLHFWSVNCPACRVEDPLLKWVKKTYGPAGLEILGVNLTDPPAALVNHPLTHSKPFPVLYDGGQGYNMVAVETGGRQTAFVVNPQKEAIVEVPGLPTTYIIDCRGEAVAYSVGPAQWNHKSVQKLLGSLISESKTCRATRGPRASSAAARYSREARWSR
jgi:thiol-disulfide isomerase/thioredoxin